MKNRVRRTRQARTAAKQAVCGACLLAAFVAGCTHANIAPGRPSAPGVPAFAQVSDTLYRGGQPTADGFAELKKMGIKTVVSLRHVGSDQRMLNGLGLQYVQIRFDPVRPEEDDVVDFLKVVTEPDNQPVFVHCLEGVNRTGMMVAVYRVVVQDWPREKALAEMKAMGANEGWVAIDRYVHDFDAEKIKQRLSGARPVMAVVVP